MALHGMLCYRYGMVLYGMVKNEELRWKNNLVSYSSACYDMLKNMACHANKNTPDINISPVFNQEQSTRNIFTFNRC